MKGMAGHRSGAPRIVIGPACVLVLLGVSACGRDAAPTPAREERKPPVVQAPSPPAQPEVRATPSPTQADLLFPHGAGDTWEMDVTAGLDRFRLRLTVSEVSAEEGVTLFTVRTDRDGKAVQSERYRIDRSGVVRTACGPDGAETIEPPMPMLKLPFAVGKTWSWAGATVGAGGPEPAKATFELSGPERVKSGVGDHQAYVVTQRFTLGGPGGIETLTNTQWLAPGLGLVRQVMDDGSQRVVSELVGCRVGGLARGTLAEAPRPPGKG